jgi:hypothetical protein
VQILKDIKTFPQSDPYRINVTITARYYIQMIETASTEEGFLRALSLKRNDTSIDTLLQQGLAELMALRERSLTRPVRNEG